MQYIIIYVHDTAAAPYAIQIVNGLKTIETRARDTLRRFIGSRVLVARTRSGHAADIVGAVNIDRGAFCSAAMLDSMRALTRIPAGSAYDCRGPGKYCYSLSRPAALKNPVKLSDLHILKRSRVYAIIDTDNVIISE